MIRHNDIMIDRQAMTITVGERVRSFKGRIFFDALCCLVLNGWTPASEWFENMYRDDPDGGPEKGEKALWGMMRQWNQRLDSLNLKIVREKRSGIAWYKVVQT